MSIHKWNIQDGWTQTLIIEKYKEEKKPILEETPACDLGRKGVIFPGFWS